jgi:hypothetical protein
MMKPVTTDSLAWLILHLPPEAWDEQRKCIAAMLVELFAACTRPRLTRDEIAQRVAAEMQKIEKRLLEIEASGGTPSSMHVIQ